MGFEQKIQLNNNLEPNGQAVINFENTSEQKETIEDIVSKLNIKYPYAKLSSSLFKLAGDGRFIYHEDQIMSREELEKYFKTESDLYDPNSDTEDEKRYK